MRVITLQGAEQKDSMGVDLRPVPAHQLVALYDVMLAGMHRQREAEEAKQDGEEGGSFRKLPAQIAV